VINISNLLAGQVATEQQMQQVMLHGLPLVLVNGLSTCMLATTVTICAIFLQVQQECEATGFLAVTGHGISIQQLQQLFSSARQLFDLPFDIKMQMVVRDMKAGRGYEISPEHKAYMQVS
jgi:isopenicillin N synthase-like dioxygenase